MDELFEGLIREGMARMRWSRKRAEQAAQRYLKRTSDTEKVKRMLGASASAKTETRPAARVRVVKASDAAVSRSVSKPADWDALLALKAEAKRRRDLKALQMLGAKPPKPLKAKRKKPKVRAKSAERPQMVGDLAAATSKSNLRKKKKRPLTPLQRLNRALGPDDGRRRGGSPFVQGGSPGLGRRS